MESRILVVDDKQEYVNILRELLEPFGHEIFTASSGQEALKFARRIRPDLILLDVMMDGMDGFETCQRLKADESVADVAIIFITVLQDLTDTLEGFRVGGVDYITKPFEKEEVLARVNAHLKIRHLIRDLQDEIALRNTITNERDHLSNRLDIVTEREAKRWGVDKIIGKSPAIRQVLELIRRVQNEDQMTVLITGESGTGKDLIARAIHYGSARRKEEFSAINCAGIPAELAESELFGHVRGAFTGSVGQRKGYFEAANGATLFLDEIGDMSLSIQAKLFRVLEDQCITPVGATQPRPVDVRLIAATNSDLLQKVRDGKFRRELYFRLAQFPISLPPLRKRREDIPLLANHFLQVSAAERGVTPPTISKTAMQALAMHHYPGNVRELQLLINYAMVMCDGTEIRPEHFQFIDLPTEDEEGTNTSANIPLNLEELKVFAIRRAISQAPSITAATKLLGVTRKTLYDNLKKYNLSTDES